MTPERYHKIGELFDAARRLPSEERSGFLAQACGADEALRHEVEALLGYDNQTDNFIDVPPLHLPVEALSSKPAPDLAGRQLDHYQIVSLLGRGGMVEVYRARDTRLDR